MPNPSTLEGDQESSAPAVPVNDGLVAPAPPEKPKRVKQKPLGVTVEQRTVAVNGKLVPMEDKHQIKTSWQETEK